MKILLTIQQYFGYLSISPSSEEFGFNLQHILTLILFLQFSLASIAYFLFTATQLLEYVDCFYALITVPLNIITFSSNVRNSPIIFKLIDGVEAAIQKRCTNSNAKNLYEKANNNANILTKFIYVSLVDITIPSIFLIQFFISFIFYFTTDMGPDSFRLPFPVEYPFDLKSPIGYTVALMLTFGAFYIIGQSCTCILGLLIGMCLIITSFIEDFEGDLIQLEGDIRNLCNFVKLHSQAKQFANQLSYIYRLIITGYYIWSVLTICDNLLSFQFELVRDPGSPIIWISLVKVFWSFIQMFFFCYFGERFTNGFSELNDAIYKCDWYSSPLKMQRMFPIIIFHTQQKNYLEGFGNVRCTLETFKNIANGGFSYFTILRQVSVR